MQPVGPDYGRNLRDFGKSSSIHMNHHTVHRSVIGDRHLHEPLNEFRVLLESHARRKL